MDMGSAGEDEDELSSLRSDSQYGHEHSLAHHQHPHHHRMEFYGENNVNSRTPLTLNLPQSHHHQHDTPGSGIESLSLSPGQSKNHIGNKVSANCKEFSEHNERSNFPHGRPSQRESVSSGGICEAIEAQLEHLGKGTTWLAIFLGQMLSGILCVSAITSVYLTDLYNIHVPNAQNFAFYIMLSGVFTTILACRPAERNLFPVLKMRGWKYALVALADAEANFLVVKAYQLTTLTSVQLLDCFSIPTVLSLSWLVLRIRYKVAHILGVSICLLGVCCLVWADIEEGRAIGPGKDRFLGDMLCLSGAFLYGVSNVAQEFVVKTFDVVEFLGMVGLFGSFVTGAQTVLLEYSAVTEADWAGPSTPLLLLLGFAAAQFSFYFLAAIVIKLSGATAYNMSILTADFYSLIVGIYLFQYKFHALYFLSFVLVMTGVIVFSIKPTLIASDIYRSLTREHTTTVDLELMASTPPPSFPFQTPSGGGCGVSGTTGLMENSSLIGDSPRLSNSSCDVVMQTGTVSNHVRRNDRGCYKENKHVYDNGQTYAIPEDDVC